MMSHAILVVLAFVSRIQAIHASDGENNAVVRKLLLRQVSARRHIATEETVLGKHCHLAGPSSISLARRIPLDRSNLVGSSHRTQLHALRPRDGFQSRDQELHLPSRPEETEQSKREAEIEAFISGMERRRMLAESLDPDPHSKLERYKDRPPPKWPLRNDVHVGAWVEIEEKPDQNTGRRTQGEVAQIMNTQAVLNFRYGIKVRLTSGTIGRVKSVISPYKRAGWVNVDMPEDEQSWDWDWHQKEAERRAKNGPQPKGYDTYRTKKGRKKR
eukprot:gnl/TRDRNA2_/TRDRNA2_162839_c0_seq1.p1 gnl/TRDRNA2_/TRDRNA2_162839_c0~~gnl/TRDRNA2_/TRDRNA2_162839_c0_seq1.p1  ORF type:complete len:272 (+),score=35.64 gnl/TRDRNA2_/TRDRNA2_162839_c0_seq1:118-933(+)